MTMMPRKHEEQMTGIMEGVGNVGRVTRRKRKRVKTRIDSSDPGMIQSDYATVVPTRQSFHPRNANLEIRALSAMILENTSKRGGRKI
jgi:hypothetical protein